MLGIIQGQEYDPGCPGNMSGAIGRVVFEMAYYCSVDYVFSDNKIFRNVIINSKYHSWLKQILAERVCKQIATEYVVVEEVLMLHNHTHYFTQYNQHYVC